MTPKLTDEQRDALSRDFGPVPVEDGETNRFYFLVDKPTLDSLRHDADRAAIRAGISDLETGRVLTLDELDARIQAKLYPQRST